jgi:hypothetical protein
MPTQELYPTTGAGEAPAVPESPSRVVECMSDKLDACVGMADAIKMKCGDADLHDPLRKYVEPETPHQPARADARTKPKFAIGQIVRDNDTWTKYRIVGAEEKKGEIVYLCRRTDAGSSETFVFYETDVEAFP